MAKERKEHNQKIARQFEQTHQRKPFDLHEVYQWAKNNNLWYPPKDYEEKKFVEEMADSLRDVYITADDGGRVRWYHARTGKNKDGRQQTFWANLFDAPLEHLEEAFQQRRRGSLGDCRQLKTDVDYCNKKRFQDNPIQISFNFDLDLAEEEAFKQMRAELKKAA